LRFYFLLSTDDDELLEEDEYEEDELELEWERFFELFLFFGIA
jgi:hypothetical protein